MEWEEDAGGGKALEKEGNFHGGGSAQGMGGYRGRGDTR